MARSLRYLIIAAWSAGTASAQTFTYSDSSTEQKLQSQVGFGVAAAEAGLSMNADMTLVGEGGVTRVLPRFSSSWSALGALDVSTTLTYEDLNRAAQSLEPRFDTRLMIGSAVPFVDRFEAKLRRSDGLATDALNMDLTRLDTGVRLFGGNPLALDAGISLQRSAANLATASSVESSFGVGGAIDVRSVWRIEDAAGSSARQSTVDTTLVYRSPVAFVDRLEGKVLRDAHGASRESLAVLFPEFSTGYEHGSSIGVVSKAVLEETLHADGAEALSMGIETKVSGFLPPLLGGRNALAFKVERMLNESRSRSSSLAYEHAWSPGAASIGLDLKVLKDVNDHVEPSMGIRWSTQF